MGVPFGFSVGDLIAGIGIIKDGIQALSDTRGAKQDYLLLTETLDTLSQALEAIQEIELDPQQDFRQHTAIKQAVEKCRNCIDSFLQRTTKYDVLNSPHRSQDWKLKLHTCCLKLKWALLKKGDIEKFQEDLQRQIQAISLLLTTLQLYRDGHQADLAQTERSQANARHETLVVGQSRIQRTQESVVNQNEALMSLMKSFKGSLSSEQGAMFELILSRQRDSEERLHQTIRAIPEQIRLTFEIPPQVNLQRPVTFTDALGRVAPIYLDFINSAEALVAILKVRFKHVGLSKIKRNEFALQEAKSSRSLDLGRPWESVMFPGQHVNMSMVFKTRTALSSCPRCKTDNDTAPKGDTTCKCCGMEYQRVEEIQEQTNFNFNLPQSGPANPAPPMTNQFLDHDPNIAVDTEDLVAAFQRVLIINQEGPWDDGWDPDCAICSLPVEAQCDCETVALATSLRQVCQRSDLGYVNESIQSWIRSCSQEYIVSYYGLLKGRRKKQHAEDVQRAKDRAAFYHRTRPHPHKIAALDAELKLGINEDWRSSAQRYPELLEYYLSLVRLGPDGNLHAPDNDDIRVRDPPLSALASRHARPREGDPWATNS